MRLRKVALIVGVAGAIAAIAVAGTALAQTPTPTPAPGAQRQERPSYAQHFLDRLAAALKIDRATLDAGLKQAANDTVDKLVQDGKMTKEQGDKLKQQDRPAWFFGPGFAGPRVAPKVQPRIPDGAREKVATMLLAGPEMRVAIANALGLTPQEVLTQLRGGKTLKQLADEKGRAEDVKKAILGESKQKLDQAVANGRMTQERADQIYKQLEQQDLLSVYGKIWGRELPRKGAPMPFRT
jgi:polyhydroxyalkanoate synthesis regulator phasin